MSKSILNKSTSVESLFQSQTFEFTRQGSENKNAGEGETESEAASGPSIGIGVDFGTSNSAAALFDGKQITWVKLEEFGLTMPSASYINKQFGSITGQAAINEYIQANQGRKVELSVEVLGESRSSTGQIDSDTSLPSTANTNLVYGKAFNDGGLPGRLFRGVKRLLGSANNQRIMIFKRPFRMVALITPILLRINRAIEHTIQTSSLSENTFESKVDHACIGHPVNFEGNATDHNNIALECLAESYHHAGIIQQNFYPEPLAATISYLYSNPQAASERVLTVDFGGGTLDLCILRQQGTSFEVEAIHGIALGGDKIDQTLYQKLLFPLLGKGERWERVVDGCKLDTLFPFDDYADLLVNWPISYTLNQNEYTTPVIDRMNQLDGEAVKFKRLYELITQNYSYQVFLAIKELKESLSVNESAILDIPEIDVELKVQRREFEEMIGELLKLFEEAVVMTLHKANVKAMDIKVVLRTGGSSLIPAVTEILEKHFSNKVVEHDPFTSVASGLAIADYFKLGKQLEK